MSCLPLACMQSCARTLVAVVKLLPALDLNSTASVTLGVSLMATAALILWTSAQLVGAISYHVS